MSLMLMPVERDLKITKYFYEDKKERWEGHPLVHTPIRYIVEDPPDGSLKHDSSDPWHYPQCTYRASAANGYYYYDTEPRKWECVYYGFVETPEGFCFGKNNCWW